MFDWLRKLFRRRKKQSGGVVKREGLYILHEGEPIYNPKYKGKPLKVTISIPKAGNRASRQNVSKFMKHGRQAPWYRKSVKARIQPEEEE